MSTHNICFSSKIRKNILWIPLLIWSYVVINKATVFDDNSGNMSHNIRKRTFGPVPTFKIQIGLTRIFTEHILDSQGCKVSPCGQ